MGKENSIWTILSPPKPLNKIWKSFQPAWGCATTTVSSPQENSEIVLASADLTERITFIFYIAGYLFLHTLLKQRRFNPAFMSFVFLTDFWYFCPETSGLQQESEPEGAGGAGFDDTHTQICLTPNAGLSGNSSHWQPELKMLRDLCCSCESAGSIHCSPR